MKRVDLSRETRHPHHPIGKTGYILSEDLAGAGFGVALGEGSAGAGVGRWGVKGAGAPVLGGVPCPERASGVSPAFIA
jgi:hypothetical protein